MTITFGSLIDRDPDSTTSKSFMVGNRLVLVNDGQGTPEDPPSSTVWDDQGNRVMAAQPFADATPEDLAGAASWASACPGRPRSCMWPRARMAASCSITSNTPPACGS